MAVAFGGLRDATGTRGRRGSVGRSVAAGEKQQVAVELSTDITTLRGSQAKDEKETGLSGPQSSGLSPQLPSSGELEVSLSFCVLESIGSFVFTSDHMHKSKSRVILVNTQQSRCLGIDWGLASPLPSGAGCPAALKVLTLIEPPHPPVTTHTHTHKPTARDQ